MKKPLPVVLVVLLTAISSGCATVSTLNQPIRDGKPLIMSGTRLDLASLRGADQLEERFGVEAPQYPLLDLPASASMDVLVLGFTLPVAMFKTLSSRWN